ncbi:MAG: hypothetical protein DI539_13910 [Flavobacterium psychrophilum]|nr:MAG: hypothetical protein DI539_13910 [Flavobacterium psychrophilum]
MKTYVSGIAKNVFDDNTHVVTDARAVGLVELPVNWKKQTVPHGRTIVIFYENDFRVMENVLEVRVTTDDGILAYHAEGNTIDYDKAQSYGLFVYPKGHEFLKPTGENNESKYNNPEEEIFV